MKPASPERPPSRLRTILTVLVICIVCGIAHGLHVRYSYILYVSSGPRVNPSGPMTPPFLVVVWFIWRYCMLAALLPLFIETVRRYPPGLDWRANVRSIGVYAMAAPLFACLSLVLGGIIFHFPPTAPPDAMRFDETVREMLASMVFQHTIFCCVIFAGLALRRYMALVRARELLAAALRTQTVEARLQALQHQLQPHFLFNSLHAVSSLIHSRPEKAVEMVGRIAGFLQLVLDRGGAVQSPLGVEITLLERYLSIESVRFSDRLRVECSIDPAARDCLVPSLLLQPLAENAIRHGIARRAEPGTLRVSARVEGARLLLEVEDDGPGPVRQSEGTGLSNTRARLGAWCGKDPFEFALGPGRSGGTSVTIALPARRPAEPAPSTPPPTPVLEPAYA